MLRQGYIETTMTWPRIYALDVIFRASASFCMVPTCGVVMWNARRQQPTQAARALNLHSQQVALLLDLKGYEKPPLQTKKARTHAPPFHSTGFNHHKRYTTTTDKTPRQKPSIKKKHMMVRQLYSRKHGNGTMSCL